MLKRGVRELIATAGRTRAGKLLLWKALPACGVERMALRTADGVFMVSTRDNMIGLTLFRDGEFDRSIVERSCAIAAAYLGAGDLTYLDVGANIGSNSVYALHDPAFARAICFEPDDVNFANLIATIELSGLAGQVRCVRAAVGEAPGLVKLAHSVSNFGDHHVIPSDGAGQPGEEIIVTTLDSSLGPDEVERVGLVCVDVQGYETQVLAGASALLARDVPFLCEITPDALRMCGGYDRIFDIAAASFNWFVDMRKPVRLHRVSDLRGWADALPAGGYGDVFLTKRPVAGLAAG